MAGSLAARSSSSTAGTRWTCTRRGRTLGGAVPDAPGPRRPAASARDGQQHRARLLRPSTGGSRAVGKGAALRSQPLRLPVIDERGRVATIGPGLRLLGYRTVRWRRASAIAARHSRYGAPARQHARIETLREPSCSRRTRRDRPAGPWDVFIRPALNISDPEARRLRNLHGPAPPFSPGRRAIRPAAPDRAARQMHGAARRPRPRRPRRLESRVESLDDLDADAVIVAVPPPEAPLLAGAPALEDSPIVSVHLLFDRPILAAPRRAPRSPAHSVFDRGALTGHEPPERPAPDGGRSGVPDLLEVRGKGLVETMAEVLTERLGPAELRWSRVFREPRATFAARPGTRSLRWPMDTSAEHVPRRRMDRLGLAGDDGGGGSLRRRSGEGGMTADGTSDLPRQRRRRRPQPPARAPGIRRLVGRRARVERDDDRRAPLLAARPRPARPRHRPAPRRTTSSPGSSDDGGLVELVEGPPDLSTTIESYVAPKMAGVDARPKALAYIQKEGGIRRARVFTKCFMALLGQWPWQRIVPIRRDDPVPPTPPSRSRTSPAGQRQTVVPLSDRLALRRSAGPTSTLRAIGSRPGRRAPRACLASDAARLRRRRLGEGAPGGGRLVAGIQPPWVCVDRHVSPRSAAGSRTRRCAPSRAAGLFMVEDATASAPRRASRRSGTRRCAVARACATQRREGPSPPCGRRASG